VQIQRYRSRISGPLLDRIDIHVEAPALSIEELRQKEPGEASSAIRERVAQAREIQKARFADNPPAIPRINARMTHSRLREHCRLSDSLGDRLQQAMKRLKLSARAYDRILRVTRTIADLEGSNSIETHHLMEAINYRTLDRRLE
jgi:magnesium chelatase family protein